MADQPPTAKVKESEAELVATARDAVSSCNWVVGECAHKWTQKYAKGRTDADFGVLVGMSGDQVFQRRRVWETFSDVYREYNQLKWSHFYVALNWDDAPECLQWSEENEATVAEMRAWRRAIHGEDLTAEPAEDWTDEPLLEVSGGELTEVRDPNEFAGPAGSSEPRPGGPRESTEIVGAVARASSESDENYSPFRSGAGSAAPKSESTDVAVLEKPKKKPQKSAEQILKASVAAVERINKQLTPEIIKECGQLPEKLRSRLITSLDELKARVDNAGW